MMKAGDIGAVHSGTSIIARGITAFMRPYARRIGWTGNIYHHTFTVIEDEGELLIAEAVGKGYQIMRPEHAYSQKEWENDIDIFTWKIPLSKEEVRQMSKYAKFLNFKITRYQFINFYYQAVKILTWGNWKAEPTLVRVYCSKASALIANSTRYTYVNPDACNPIDVVSSLDLILSFKPNLI